MTTLHFFSSGGFTNHVFSKFSISGTTKKSLTFLIESIFISDAHNERWMDVNVYLPITFAANAPTLYLSHEVHRRS